MKFFKNFVEPAIWTPWTAASKGRRDGQQGIPRENDYVVLSKEASTANHSADRKEVPLSHNGHKADGKGKPDSESLSVCWWEEELIQIAEGKIARRLKAAEKELHAFKSRAHYLYYGFRSALREYESHVNAHAVWGFREPSRVTTFWSFAILFIIGVGELVFVGQSLPIMRIDDMDVWPLAASIILSIALLGKFSGTFHRQFKWWRSKGYGRSAAILGFISIAFILLAFLAVAILRFQYLTNNDLSISIDWSQIFILLCLGLPFVLLAHVLSFHSTCPDGDQVEVVGNKHRTLRKVKKWWRPWIRVASSYDSTIRVLERDIEIIKRDTLARIAEYRAYNLASRHEGVPCPDFFHTQLSLGVFDVRPLSEDLDRPPKSLDKVISEIEEEARKSTPKKDGNYEGR